MYVTSPTPPNLTPPLGPLRTSPEDRPRRRVQPSQLLFLCGYGRVYISLKARRVISKEQDASEFADTGIASVCMHGSL